MIRQAAFFDLGFAKRHIREDNIPDVTAAIADLIAHLVVKLDFAIRRLNEHIIASNTEAHLIRTVF